MQSIDAQAWLTEQTETIETLRSLGIVNNHIWSILGLLETSFKTKGTWNEHACSLIDIVTDELEAIDLHIQSGGTEQGMEKIQESAERLRQLTDLVHSYAKERRVLDGVTSEIFLILHSEYNNLEALANSI